MELPIRSHESELTDGELILFDFLFEATAPRSMLGGENFSIHNNTSYSHGFTASELDTVLTKLINQGVLFSEQGIHQGKQEQFFGLTAKGGELWESERKPIWDRFIEDSEEFLQQKGIRKIRLRSYSKETLSTSSIYYAKSHFLGIPESKQEYTQNNSSSLIYWKKQRIVYECTYLARDVEPCYEANSFKTNWVKYEKNRTWWRNISELQKHLA